MREVRGENVKKKESRERGLLVYRQSSYCFFCSAINLFVPEFWYLLDQLLD